MSVTRQAQWRGCQRCITACRSARTCHRQWMGVRWGSSCQWRTLDCSCFFFSSRRRHTRLQGDWSSDVCSSDLSTWIKLPGGRIGYIVRSWLPTYPYVNPVFDSCSRYLRGTVPHCSTMRPKFSVLRSEEHTSELQSPCNLVCRLLLEKKITHYLN